MTNSFLLELKENLKTQDNFATEHPLYVVEEKVRDWGLDPKFDDEGSFCWVCGDEFIEESDPTEITRLNALEDLGEDTGDCQKLYYKERWQFVTLCLTHKGCTNYIENNSHRHQGDLRVFIGSAYRNKEVINLRNALLGDC